MNAAALAAARQASKGRGGWILAAVLAMIGLPVGVGIAVIGMALQDTSSRAAAAQLAAAATANGNVIGFCSPATTPATGALTPAQTATVALAAGFPPTEAVTAVAVAKAESNLIPTARNSIGASGEWQILQSAHPEFAAQWADGTWADPAVNAAMAYRVWLSAGRSWQPWQTFTEGSYLPWLSMAQTAVASAGGAIPTSSCAPIGPGGLAFPISPATLAAPPVAYTQDQGVDIAAPCGTTLVAMASGTVIGEGISGFGPYAPQILIDTGPWAGRTLYLGHAQADLVAVGTHVAAGQPVAQVGNLGISEGCHLEVGLSAAGAPPGSIPAMGQTSSEMLAALLFARL